MARAQGRPTIDDVAAVAGVSRSTVSRVLTGDRWVSPAAERAVRAAIEQTGYIVSRSARSLRTGRANAVGLVIADRHDHLFEDPTFSLVVPEIDAALGPENTLYLTLATTTAARRGIVDQARSGALDGLILAATRDNDPIHEMIATARVPAVAITEPWPSSGVPFVAVDEASGAEQAARHLIDRGRQHIAVIAGPVDTVSGRRRAEGFRRVLPAEVIHVAAYGLADGEQAALDLLDRQPSLDAIFAASDVLALGALTALRRSGRRVPEDIALIGFDDTPAAARSEPALTTVRLPFGQLARRAVALLRTPSVPQPPVRCELVVRASAG